MWHILPTKNFRVLFNPHSLVKLAQQDEPWSLDALANATELDSHALQQALRWAERHDILRKLSDLPKSSKIPPTWMFCVPLMRRWLKQRS